MFVIDCPKCGAKIEFNKSAPGVWTIVQEARQIQRDYGKVRVDVAAQQLGYSESQVRRIFKKLEHAGVLEKIGQRGGWKVARYARYEQVALVS